jgi:uncharacterized protein with NRDE domain
MAVTAIPPAVCTLVLAWRVFEGTPIVVAANRDERLVRPSRPPSVSGTDPWVLAPRDEKAGGTWMGVNEHRVFAGLTNRWLDTDREPERSRGLLVDAVLDAESAASGLAMLRSAVAAHTYDGFNLLVADRDRAILIEYDGALRHREFDPGVHVVVNTGADGTYELPAVRESIARTQGRNADRVRTTLEPESDESAAEWLTRAKTVLGDHDYGVCIHGDGYGTVSTSLVAIGADGTVDYRYADGPPCRTEARRVDNQV